LPRCVDLELNSDLAENGVQGFSFFQQRQISENENRRMVKHADLEAPIVSNARTLAKVLQRLVLARERLGEKIVERVPDVITRAGRLLLDPNHPLHKRALLAGERNRMTPQMTREALRNLFRGVTIQRLRAFRQRELAVARGYTLYPPTLVFHNLAGNLFLSGLESIILGMLAGGANLVRCSNSDRSFPRIWQEAVNSIDEAVGKTIFVGWWEHSALEITRTAMEHAHAVLAYGEDETIRTLRNLAPSECRFIGHGNRVSFALLDETDLQPKRLARLCSNLAYDFLIYDQRGCMSPLGVFVVSRTVGPVEQFCEMLCQSFRKIARRFPGWPFTLEEQATVAAIREEARIGAALALAKHHKQLCTTKIISREDDPFLLLLQPAQDFTVGCGLRTAHVWWASSYETVFRVLQKLRGQVSTIGVAHTNAQWAELALSVRAGRLCKIGQMQKPSLGWAHDGFLPLLPLMTVVRIE
jgi:hypothetical protein